MVYFLYTMNWQSGQSSPPFVNAPSFLSQQSPAFSRTYSAVQPSLPVLTNSSAPLDLPDFEDSGVGPWRCPRCQKNNTQEVTTCVCLYRRIAAMAVPVAPSPARPVPQMDQPTGSSQVWTCPKCRYEYNMQAHANCQKCNTAKPNSGQSSEFQPQVAARPSTCQTCYQPVTACICRAQFQSLPVNTSALRLAQAEQSVQVWTCAQCRYEYNLQETMMCLKCRAAKPGTGQGGMQGQQSQTWTCVHCSNSYNPREASECCYCKTRNPNRAQTAPPAPIAQSPHSTGPIWKCSVCSYDRNSQNLQCQQCKNPRNTSTPLVSHPSPSVSQLPTVLPSQLPSVSASSQATMPHPVQMTVNLTGQMHIVGDKWICHKCSCMNFWVSNVCANCKEPSAVGIQMMQYFRT